MADKIISLYGGAQHIEFKDDEHSYRWIEKDLFIPGVTSILKILQKPALIPWASNMSAASFRRQVGDWMAATRKPLIWADFEKELAGFEANAKAAYRTFSEKASDIGTLAHSYAEARLKDAKPPNMETWPTEALKAADAVDEWMATHKLVVNKSFVERIVFSIEYFYAGTVDAPITIDGIPGVYDFKAAKAFARGDPYLEYKLQLAAYAVALEEEFPNKKIDQGGIIRLDKITGKPTLHRVALTHDLKEAWIRTRGLYQALDKVK